jgi:hypothetical protein
VEAVVVVAAEVMGVVEVFMAEEAGSMVVDLAMEACIVYRMVTPHECTAVPMLMGRAIKV